jgi:signal transduction histidine kinase
VTQFSRLNAILIASAPLESACVLTFRILFFGLKWPRYSVLIFAPGLLLAVIGMFGGPAPVREFFMLLAVPTVGLCLALLALIAAQAALKWHDVVSFIFGCAVTVVLTCWLHDLLQALRSPDRRLFHAAFLLAMLVAIGAGRPGGSPRAQPGRQLCRPSRHPGCRQAEERLKASFAREEESARAAALALERTRLMRDLHDGLGGQLVSIVALSERGNATAPIGDAARAALKDLRLVIDSMDDIGGDLMLALGSWRERAMAQLRPHDIALEWHVLTPQGLPVHPELRPWHVIQIMRLLDEALTNAVKHAGARRITVTIETLGDEAGDTACGCILVADDGKGLARPDGKSAADGAAGRACATCEGRARCGADLELRSAPRHKRA